MGKWGRLFGRGSYSTYNSFGYGGIGGRSAAPEPRKSTPIGRLGHTLNIGPHMVNQFTMGEMDSYLLNYGSNTTHRFKRRSASATYSPISSTVAVLIPTSNSTIRMARIWAASAAQTTPTPTATTRCGNSAKPCPTSMARIPSRWAQTGSGGRSSGATPTTSSANTHTATRQPRGTRWRTSSSATMRR